jgi:hypothetical protein
MSIFNVLWTALTWWQIGLLIIYILYTFIRSWIIWSDGSYMNLWLGYAKSVKLYHLVIFILDIPAFVLGMFFPVIKKILSIDVFPLKRNQ